MEYQILVYVTVIVKYKTTQLFQHDGIPDANITSYQVDLRVANSERLPDLWISVPEEAQIYEQPGYAYVPGSPKSYIYVIGLC